MLYGTAGVLGKAAALVTVPYLTRQLGPGDYGLVDLATSLSGLLVLLVRFAGDIPTMRLAAQQEGECRKRTYFAFVATTAVVSLAVATLLLPTSAMVSTVIWSVEGAGFLAFLAMVLIPINATQAALASVLRFVQRPRSFAFVAAVDLLAQVGLAVAFVAAGFGPTGVLLGYLAGGSIGLVVSALAVRTELAAGPTFRTSKQLFLQGLPFLPGVVAFYFADAAARVVAANSLGVVSVGHLGLAIRVGSVMSLVSSAFSAAWGPRALSLVPAASTRDMFGRVMANQTLLITLGALCLGAVAPEIAVVAGGNAFAPAAATIPGLLLSAGLISLLFVLTTAAGIGYRGAPVAYSATAGAVTQVALVIMLVPILGLGGFGIAAVSGRLVAIALLGRAVSHIARFGAVTLTCLCLAVPEVAAIQWLNETPSTTWAIRAICAVVGATGIGLVLYRIVVANGSSDSAPPTLAPPAPAYPSRDRSESG